MGKPQALGRTKHTRVLSRVNYHLQARGIHASPGAPDEGSNLTCPGGATASLCQCRLFGMTQVCADYERAHPR